MLDFILVMGHVPGTNIDLTFYQLVLGIPIIGAIIYLLIKKPLFVKRYVIVAYIHIHQLQLFLRNKLPA